MTEKAISFDIKGIKCDNPECDYKDMGVKFDPEYFLNRPCPKCGSNLFTQADYNSMMRLFKIARVVNAIFHPWRFLWKNGKTKRLGVHMDGSGKIKVEEKHEN